ncbi:LysM peptidoglycan-binding domain-containing protein [Aeromicrobium duanguangcaii]|uniref:LysM peptidoglycan-binding domain-containing protein n=1 Tax=Aeromicrobium duanguangcaii TaxID=2968086 RepID=A0ABY5KH78_9ACTN|nr:LysM domain-containing protein [Aeromicrobium duanguangcaii]MCD9153205.1 LysM peptidoglycan-binding domain-containing protein [Aeromicrobium duanguangcaii]MCL3836802.1 LysM peptidoglycan-binding domain-containing protein [Aeromicrobium duanguangcaii]UUI69695.1 LysM peptidoglycan-binding domain-containing protein [Aeromicrobium duanguangcaii]
MSITLDHSPFSVVDLPRRPMVTRTTYQATGVAPAAPLRLTGRGRIALVAVALAVISALVIVFGSAVVASDSAAEPGIVTTVTVQPGQTLWSIAAEARPDADIRSTVDEIVKLNALEDGAALPIGTTLAVPTTD